MCVSNAPHGESGKKNSWKERSITVKDLVRLLGGLN